MMQTRGHAYLAHARMHAGKGVMCGLLSRERGLPIEAASTAWHPNCSLLLSSSYGAGLFCFALLLALSLLALLEFGVLWSATWSPEALDRTMIIANRRKPISAVAETELAYEADALGE